MRENFAEAKEEKGGPDKPGVSPQGSGASDARTSATGGLLGNLSPDLQEVVDAWPELPEAMRAGILAMVKAVKVRP